VPKGVKKNLQELVLKLKGETPVGDFRVMKQRFRASVETHWGGLPQKDHIEKKIGETESGASRKKNEIRN